MGLCLVNAVWLVALMPISAQTTDVLTSPDRALRAFVMTNAVGESWVEFQALPERVLLRRDDRSKDGEHGSGVVHAAWTSDSQFFVASTAASGGRQPWARPLWVYSRTSNRVIELWKLGMVATGDFTLKPPDIVETTIHCPNENRDRPYAVSLHSLLSAGRLPASPSPAR
jgi:hypothetical protein